VDSLIPSAATGAAPAAAELADAMERTGK